MREKEQTYLQRGAWASWDELSRGVRCSGVHWQHLHALLLGVLGTVCAIKELPLEKLDRDDSEDEHEELVDNEYVEDILQGRHHAIEDSLWGEGRAQVHEALARTAKWGHGAASQPHREGASGDMDLLRSDTRGLQSWLPSWS